MTLRQLEEFLDRRENMGDMADYVSDGEDEDEKELQNGIWNDYPYGCIMLDMREKRTSKSWTKRLKAIRTRLKLTQEQAAEKLDVPVATWRNWEQGRNEPNAGMARLIDIIFPAE